MSKKKRILIFSCFILLFSLCCCIFTYGNDYYWHVKIGEYIFNNKTIPYTDIFSWYGKSQELHWISHEWLSEIIIFLFTKLFHHGAFIYTLTTIFFIGIIIFNNNRNFFYKNPFYAVLWGLIGCLIFGSKILPRPHLISYLLFTLTVYLAYDLYQNKDSKNIYISFIIAILWGNCHGGSSNLSYFIYGIFFFFSLFNLKSKKFINHKKELVQTKKYLAATLLSIIGICINPHGLTMLIYPYQNMTYTKMIDCISEWQSLNIFRIDGMLYFIFILFIVIVFLKNKEKLSVIDSVFLLFFSILGIKSIKFIPYLYIVSSFFIFNYLKPLNKSVNIDIISVFTLIIYILLYGNLNLNNSNIISNKIINYLKENSNLKLYNNYNTGGYLIYKDIKPFIDGRADLYIHTIFSDCCDIEKTTPTKLENYDFDLYLVVKNSKPYYYLSKNKEKFEIVMNDKKYYLFKNKTS